MTASDVSRYLFQPQKHYVGARWQQGRCVLDADFNEHASLDDEEQRRLLGHVIGPVGSPDAGFFPELALGSEVVVQSIAFNGAAPTQVLNYHLQPGTMYLGGLRFQAQEGGVPIAFQRDFLQMQASDAPRAAAVAHTQLCYLRGWEQSVSALEDEEIRERALGGADTSVRVRRMARVEVAEVTAPDCAVAWAAVRDKVEAASGATFDASGVELQSSARLRVTFVDGAAQDACAPCGPHDTGRYLGADNQALRIMLVAPNRYVWAINNASPLYRAQLGSNGSSGLVTLLTPPRDEARWPLSNTVLEFLPWGALLDNGQKVSHHVGTFVRVTRGYDPADRSCRIDPADVARINQMVRIWDAAHPDFTQLPNTKEREGDYLFVRAWHRLDSDTDEVLLDTAPGPANHTLLRRLGLQPEFSGGGRPGDYWTVTVRPNTPQQIVPWDLARPGGVPPHGPREFLAPLALIGFRPPVAGEHAGTEVVQSLFDCRRKFDSLTTRSGCCTHSVGDGVSSRGDYSSVQAAIDALPDAGGKVCILPGRYSQTFSIARDDVVVEGCGVQSQLVPSGAAADGMITILGSRVTVGNLFLEARGQVGIVIGKDGAESERHPTEDVRLEKLEVVAGSRAGAGGQARTAVEVRSGRRIAVVDSEFSMTGNLSDDSVLFASGEDIRFERNRVETIVSGANGAWGGIQIGGGARRVTVRRNHIVGGIGHGITLGSLNWIRESTGIRLRLGPAVGLVDQFDPCKPKQPQASPVDRGGERFDPETAGDLQEIDISDNRIEGMSGNGISVLTTLPLAEGDGEDLITVNAITIEGNTIVDCVRQLSSLSTAATKTKKSSSDQHEIFGQFSESSVPPGGIVLVDGERVVVRNNVIRDNGVGENQPICGVSIRFGDGIVISGNQISNNGRRAPGTLASTPTTRAGISVGLAGVISKQAPGDHSDVFGFSLRVANNCVDHPNGPALAARATGPLAVLGNHLTSRGNNASVQPSGRAHTVVLTNLGMPWEALDLPADEPSTARWRFPSATAKYLRDDDGAVASGESDAHSHVMGHGGQVLFNDNHVTLDWQGISGTGGLVPGFSVGICSRDDVSMTGNQLALHIEDVNVKKDKSAASGQQPHLAAHAAIVGATANVSHNRIAEGINDALISLLALGGLLASCTHNIATHAIYGATCASVSVGSADPPSGPADELISRGNLVWFRRQTSTSTGVVIDDSSLNITAHQLLAALCAECLGLRGRVPLNLASLLNTFFSSRG